MRRLDRNRPFGDRGERASPGQHRAHRQRQDHRQPVADPSPVPGMSDLGQHRQQPGRGLLRHLGEVSEVADGRVYR
jgi:hypothetical protein